MKDLKPVGVIEHDDLIVINMTNGDRIRIESGNMFQVTINGDNIYRRDKEPSVELLEDIYKQTLIKRKYKFL